MVRAVQGLSLLKFCCVCEWGCCEWQIIIKQMSSANPGLKHPKILRKHHSDSDKHGERGVLRLQVHRFSEPRSKIKISKNKLPADFFLKKDVSSRRITQQRLYFPEAFSEPFLNLKVESERTHISPERTSFFGFFEEKQTQNASKFPNASKLTSRKFESREQPKRDAFTMELARKLMTANEPVKYELLELFPSTYNDQLTGIMMSSAKSSNLKASPKKEMTGRQREADPEKGQEYFHSKELFPVKSSASREGESTRSGNNAFLQNSSCQLNEMNITFSNAASKCLPPIRRIV